MHRVQADLAACRVQLDEARAQSSKHALTAQENDKRVAVLQAEARVSTLAKSVIMASLPHIAVSVPGRQCHVAVMPSLRCPITSVRKGVQARTH